MKTTDKTTLFQAIEAYKQAVYTLGKCMAAVKQTNGKVSLEAITNFDTHRINTLLWLSDLAKVHGEALLPEALIEFYNADKTKIKEVFKDTNVSTLKPRQIRKLLRKAAQTVKAKDKPIKVNSYMRNLLLLANEVKGMDTATRQRALAQLANTLTELQ
jgi:hypothetical protein